jgi:glucose/arabinose dehydrogenase
MQNLPNSQLTALENLRSSVTVAGGSNLVFIDANLNAYRSLAAATVPGAEVVILDANQDGVQQITDALANRSGVGAIHLISHGSESSLQLGNSFLAADTLADYSAQIQSWSQSLTTDADILLYGCDVASDETGWGFVSQLGQLTGADVAASVDKTGNAALGGNWILEVATGAIDTKLALSKAIQSSYGDVLASFNYANFNTIDGIVLNGNASKAGTSLQLTPAVGDQAGSAFYATPFAIDGNTSFNTQFQFQLTGGEGTAGADGFTFVIQNSPSGANALGGRGGSVGYANIIQSVAVEFDTYQNGTNDPNDNHISILQDGNLTALKNAVTSVDLNGGGVVNAWIDYDGATNRLDVYLSTTTTKPGTAVISEIVDLAAVVGSQAYFGFTAGTGGFKNAQAIQSWNFTTTANPVGTGVQPPGSGNGLRGEYFDNINFTNSQLVRTDSTVNFNWGNGSPDGSIAPDTFSVRWTGQIEARNSELYTFYTTTDDGVRLTINGQQVINSFIDQASTTRTGTFQMVAGQKYNIQMDYYENGGLADAKLEWSSASQARQIVPRSQLYSTAPPPPPAGSGDGLKGTYYNNRDFTAEVFNRVDGSVNFNWGSGSPDSRIQADTFSVVWTGQVEAQFTEDYTFFTTTDDGVRLFVNGQQVINQFRDQAATTVNGTPIRLTAGQKYDIRMEYYENGGAAVAQLGWQSASQARQIIPQARLFSTGGGGGNPGVFEIDVTGVTVRESDGTAVVRVNRVGGSTGVATVDYIANEDTAKRGTDFTATSGTLTFAAGETSKTFSIPIINDTVAEDTEGFAAALVSATGASLGTRRTTPITILDDDAASSFAFSQAIYEIREDGGQATVTIRRSGSTVGAASVQYATSNGTATAGSDYTAATGTLSFAAGETSKTFVVPIINDTVGERNESINLTLSSPTGATLGTQQTATLNILDNDPGSFTRETLVSGLTTPTAIEWTPNGQYMFIAEQNGLVKVANTANNQLQATPFIDLRDDVNGVRDRGLLGMVLDPQFESGRPYVYLLYTYDTPEAGNTSRPGYSTTYGGRDQPGNRTGRLVRVEAEFVGGNWRAKAGSQIVLLGKNSTFANIRGFDANSTLNDAASRAIPASGFVRDAQGNNTAESVQDFIASDSESHSVGGLQFGRDGKLYVTIGDGTSYNFADPRTDRVQDIDNLSGKVLRIDPDTGRGLADNPFYNVNTGSQFDTKYNSNLDSNRSKVYSLGLRNPFRFTMNPTTGEPVIGDVGWFSWEEINTGRGKNFGWPAYEGGLDGNGNPVSLLTPDYQNLSNIRPFYPGGARDITEQSPLFAFQHQPGGGNAIIMGDYYTGNTFPSFYDNALFYSDASRGTVTAVFFDQTGRVSGTSLFADNVQGITELEVGPDGSLYAVNLGIPIGGAAGTGSLSRWRPNPAANARTRPNAPVIEDETDPAVKNIKGGLFTQR